MNWNYLIFSTESYKYFSELLAENLYVFFSEQQLWQIEKKTFPDWEYYHRILSPVYNKNVILIWWTITDKETLELYDLATGLVSEGCNSLTIITPYFWYSTMDRRTKDWEVIKSEIRAKLLSSLPSWNLKTKILFLDLHTEHLLHYFTRDVLPFQLNTKLNFSIYLKNKLTDELKIKESDLILLSPDQWRKKAVELLGKGLELNTGYCIKNRIDGAKIEITDCSINTKDKHVIICDDMIRTGGTMIEAAEFIKKQGAKHISLFATHWIFSNYINSEKKEINSFERLLNSCFDKIIVYNTHPNVLACEKIAKELKKEDKFIVLDASEIYSYFLTYNK